MSIGFLLQFYHDPQAFPAALITYLCDPVDFLLQTDILHRGDKTRLHDLERHLGNDNLLLTAAQVLDLGLGAQVDPSFTCAVSIHNPVTAHNCPASREIGAFDKGHDVFQLNVRLLHHGDASVDNLTQIMRRNLRGEAGRNSARAVNQKIRIT
ncbi:hypothetical protein D3C80_1006660 [compost metagenome]